jgi:hypothetical protein
MFEAGLELGPSQIQVINFTAETLLSGYTAVLDTT